MHNQRALDLKIGTKILVKTSSGEWASAKVAGKPTITCGKVNVPVRLESGVHWTVRSTGVRSIGHG
jgi:hypothetical protein